MNEINMYLGSLSLSQLKEQAYNLPEINRNTQLGKQGLMNIPLGQQSLLNTNIGKQGLLNTHLGKQGVLNTHLGKQGLLNMNSFPDSQTMLHRNKLEL